GCRHARGNRRPAAAARPGMAGLARTGGPGAGLRPRHRLAQRGAVRFPQAPARLPGDRLTGLLPLRDRGPGPHFPGSSKMQFSMSALRRLLAGLAFGCLALSTAMADAATSAPEPIATRIGKAVEAWTGGRYQAKSVNATPIEGLYEVRIFNDLFYVDEAARHSLVEGEMIDMQSSRNITRDRLDEILAIDFSALPLDLALKQVVGKGSRRIALFEDPNCGYCRKLRADLA